MIVGYLLISRLLSSSYVLDIRPLSDMELVKISFHSVGCLFFPLTVSFALQKIFSFMRSHLLIVDLSAYAIGIMSIRLSTAPICLRLFPTLSSISVNVYRFILRL